jgi:hypothetical protein
MSQSSRIVFGALAAPLTFGAVQIAPGQEFAGRFQAVTEPVGTAVHAGTGVNRAAKADRADGIPTAASSTRTISMQVDSLADTSILVRIPWRKEARNLAPAPAAIRPDERKPGREMTLACEPSVSVLTEVARLLEPGRCVT